MTRFVMYTDLSEHQPVYRPLAMELDYALPQSNASRGSEQRIAPHGVFQDGLQEMLARAAPLWSKHRMAKLYACCTDPKCRTYQNMILKLQVWGIDTKPRREGKRHYFEAPVCEYWTKARQAAFKELVRRWPTEH